MRSVYKHQNETGSAVLKPTSAFNPAQAFADLRREIGALRAQRRDISIKVGSLKVFGDAIQDAVGVYPTKRPSNDDLSSVSFLGAQVVENPILPRNMVVILDGPNVINIIKIGGSR